MKKSLLLSMLFVVLFSINVNAGGVVLESGGGVYTSILHKTFCQNKYNGKSVERWILLQTNIPDFELNSARKQANKEHIPFTREYQDKYVLKIHEKLLNSFHEGWYFYLLARNDEVIFRNSINLGNNIYVYKKQPKTYKHKVVPIVNYKLGIIPDIQIDFLDSGNLSFWVTIPEVDSSSMFNKFKYRGEGLQKFFERVVFNKYEDALKNNNHYK